MLYIDLSLKINALHLSFVYCIAFVFKNISTLLLENSFTVNQGLRDLVWWSIFSFGTLRLELEEVLEFYKYKEFLWQ